MDTICLLVMNADWEFSFISIKNSLIRWKNDTKLKKGFKKFAIYGSFLHIILIWEHCVSKKKMYIHLAYLNINMILGFENGYTFLNDFKIQIHPISQLISRKCKHYISIVMIVKKRAEHSQNLKMKLIILLGMRGRDDFNRKIESKMISDELVLSCLPILHMKAILTPPPPPPPPPMYFSWYV